MRAFSAVAFFTMIASITMPSPQDRLPRWLAGCWERAVGADRIVQRWVIGSPNVLFGAVWTVPDAHRLDVMRLSLADGALRLDKIPLTGAPETRRVTEVAGRRVLQFEPPDSMPPRRFDELGHKVACSSVLNPATDTIAMRLLHERDERAVVAGDADALEQLWTDDIVALAPGSPPTVGRANNGAGLRQSLARSRDVVTLAYRLRVDDTHVIGDHTIEWGGFEGRVRPRNDSAATTVSGNMLRVIRRGSDGEWRVARTMFTTH